MINSYARNYLKQIAFSGRFSFSAPLSKKQKMELTLRTPYKTYLNKFDGFSRIITKSNEASLVIQNKLPAAIYILPPGLMKIKFAQEVKGVPPEFMHLGGWAVIHMYISGRS